MARPKAKVLIQIVVGVLLMVLLDSSFGLDMESAKELPSCFDVQEKEIAQVDTNWVLLYY